MNIEKKTAIEKKKRTLLASQFLVSALLVAFSTSVMSGAWVPGIGSGYSKLAFFQYNADDFFGDDTAVVDFSGRNISYYGEYGFAESFAVYGSLLYQDLEQINSAGDEAQSTGFGDTELGVRYQWQAEPFVLSTSFLAKLPYLYDKYDSLPRGSGETDYEMRILLGRSLNKLGYVGLEAGYRLRNGSSSDEYRYLFEYGFSVNPHLYLRTKMDMTSSVDKSNATDINGNLSISSGFDLIKIELTAGWVFGNTKSSNSQWGVEVTYRQDLAGDNALKGDSIELGLTTVF